MWLRLENRLEVASGQAGDAVLDLRGGVDANGNPYWSHVGDEYVAIAFDADDTVNGGTVVIENAQGGGGNDKIIGNNADNLLLGGGGTDTIEFYGSFGNDGVSEGEVIVIDGDTIEGDESGYDFTTLSGGGLEIEDGSGNSIQLTDWEEDGDYGIMLSNPGVVLHGTSGNERPGDLGFLGGGSGDDTIYGYGGHDELRGYGGNDYLDGGSGDDQLDGGDGRDTLIGGSGDDTYDLGVGYLVSSDDDFADLVIISPTSGIEEKISYFDPTEGDQIDLTAFADVGFADLSASAYGDVSNYNSSGIIVTLPNNQTLDLFRFGDSATFSEASLQITEGMFIFSPPETPITGTAGDDILTGGTGRDEINGEGGNDSLRGGDSSDTLNGGDGNDTLAGDLGNDSLDGGAGNDTLNGDDGRDTLSGGVGDDYYHVGLGDAVNTGISREHVIQDSDGVGDIAYRYDSQYIVFLDGDTTQYIGSNMWEYSFTHGNPALGDVTITYELDGSDLLVSDDLNSSNLVRIENWSSGDFGITLAAIGDLNLQGTAGDDTLTGDIGNDTIEGLAGNDSLSGGDGNDSLDGGDGNDSFVGGLGADTITTGTGSDVIQITNTPSEATTVTDFDVATDVIDASLFTNETVDAQESGGNTTLTFSDGQTIVLQSVTLGDLTASNLLGAIFPQIEDNNLESRLIVGTTSSDTLDGGAGNDTMFGGTSIVDPNDGNDSVLGGEGDDWLFGNGNNDTIIGGSSETDSLDGNDIIYGGFEHDVIYGSAGDDWISGQNGNDTLTGGDGADTYFYGHFGGETVLGENGNDVINDFDLSADKIQVMQQINGTSIISASDLMSRITYSGGDAFIDIGNTLPGGAEEIQLLNITSGSLQESHFEIVDDDPNTHTLNYLTGYFRPLQLSTQSTVSGSNAGDTITIPDVNTVVQGFEGNDVITATASSAAQSIVYAGSGNDTVDAGQGDDIIYGEDGTDTIVFNGLFGSDTVIGGEVIVIDNDTIDGTESGYSYHNPSGGGLKIIKDSTGDSVFLDDWSGNGDYGIQPENDNVPPLSCLK